MTDIIAGLSAKWLAGRQAKSLNDARAKALAANPDLPQQEYQSAREAMPGKDFATTPAGAPCIPCMANAKAKRRAERLDLVNHSLAGCPEHADVAARLRGDMDQVENARVAKVAAEPDKILAYHVDGEVVTKTQESGIAQYFSHPAPGVREVTPPTSDTLSSEDRHGMDEVIGSIEKQKTADEATLKTCLAGK